MLCQNELASSPYIVICHCAVEQGDGGENVQGHDAVEHDGPHPLRVAEARSHLILHDQLWRGRHAHWIGCCSRSKWSRLRTVQRSRCVVVIACVLAMSSFKLCNRHICRCQRIVMCYDTSFVNCVISCVISSWCKGLEASVIHPILSTAYVLYANHSVSTIFHKYIFCLKSFKKLPQL